MISRIPLTERQREASQRNFNRYNMLNGASYACLGETVVILFALKLGAPNVVAAAIGAMVFLGYFLLPLGVLRTGQVGAARSQADFWVCRNLAALLVVSSALLLPFSRGIAWGTLLTGSFLFYGFRAAGVVMAQPLIGDITTDGDRAKLLGESSAWFYLSELVFLILVTLLLGVCDRIGMLIAILVSGSVLGIAASAFIRRVDETSSIGESARRPLAVQFGGALRDPVLLRQIPVGFLFNLANILIVPVSIMMLKRGYGISDRQTVLFCMVQFASAILGSSLTSFAIRKTGTRKFALYTYLLIFPVCVFWTTFSWNSDSILSRIPLAVPFFLLGIYVAFYNNALIHYFLLSVPKERQVADSMVLNVVTGVAASLCAMGIAWLLLKWTEALYGDGIGMFRAYFAGAGGILLAGIVFVLRLPDVRPEEGDDRKKSE